MNLTAHQLHIIVAHFRQANSLFATLTLFLCLVAKTTGAQETQLHKIYIPSEPLLSYRFQEVKASNLPIRGTKAIYQSSDETVWISTERDGLLAYNGGAIRHYRFDPNNENALPGNRVEEVWEESPYILWITTHDRIVKLNRLSGQMKRFPVNSRYVCKTPDGTLYTTVLGKGLYRIDTTTNTLHRVKGQSVHSDKGVSYPDENITFVNNMKVANDGTIWAIGKTKTIEGLFHFEPASGNWIWHAPTAYYKNKNKKEILKIDKETNTRIISTAAIYIDDVDRVWFGGWGEGLLCYTKKTGLWQQFYFYRNANAFFDDNIFLHIAPRGDQELWIKSGTNGFVFNHRQLRVYDFTFLHGKGAASLFQYGPVSHLTDHNSNWWIAGEYGVFKYNPRQDYFSPIIKSRLPITADQLLTAVYQMANDHFLLGVGYPDFLDPDIKSEILEIKQGNVRRRIRISKETDNFWPQQFIQAGKDELYYCAMNLHRLKLSSDRLKTIPVTITNEPTYDHIDFYNNILWNDSTLFSCRRTSANAGLVKVNTRTGKAFVYKNNNEQLSASMPQDNSLLRIMRDSYNRIWCGVTGGIDIFYPDTETFEHYSQVEGDSTSLLGMQPRFVETPDRTFYIVSQSGVCATKAVPGTKARFTRIAYLDGAWIVADKAGKLWVGTEEGVARIDPATKQYKIYKEKDGYYWHPMRRPHVLANGLFIMHDGAIIDPTAINGNKEKPVARLTGFLVAGQPHALDTAIEFKKHIRLANDENFFSFSFRCNNYINEEDNRYRYRLAGADRAWVEAGNRTEAYYTALKPGMYHFYVQAANNDGVWGEAQNLVTVTIVPAWYQTVFFKIALALVLVLTVFAFYRQRMMHLRTKLLAEKQKAEAKQREAELKSLKANFEKQLAQTEMAALRSQMNPHFIFNCLNSIKLYTMQNDTEAATEYLTKFSRLMRLVLENSRRTCIPLAAELETLQLYIDMEVMRFKKKLSYAINVSDSVDLEFIEVPPLLIQPYVENAIWHGLMHKEEGGHIAISVAMEGANLLNITVADNGIGRVRATELKSKTATAQKSFGMKVTTERIALINQLYKTNTTVAIHDLVDTEGSPAGTEVNIKIPLP
ncbi:MAG TPA: histidine kinase [Flavisolibacter sp.]|jgi:streptogramin lyase|nr:histidine kinase [Flavisolibacter sp.]